MILRVLLAALAIWGMTWSKDASAIYMHETCNTVLVGWNGHEAIYELRCTYQNWEWGGDYYDPDPGYGGGGGGGGTAPAAVDAPVSAPAITCGDLAEIRSSAACHVAAKVKKFMPGMEMVGRTITIQWSTGTVETYVQNGSMAADMWMSPVPGTCHDE